MPDSDAKITLVPFEPGRDLELVGSWLRKPHITRWWGDPDKALVEVEARPEGGGDALIVVDDAPVGYIRWQRPDRAELDDAGLFEITDTATDIDIAIGEAEFLGRGIGSAAIASLRDTLVEQGVRTLIIGTSVENERALRAYEKAGFSRLRRFDDPECGACWLLTYEAGPSHAEGSPVLDSSVRIARGIEPDQAVQAADLFILTFGEMLSGLALPNDRTAAVTLLADSLHLPEIYAAVGPTGLIVGVAFVTGHGPVLSVRRDALLSAFGPLGGSLRYAVYRLISARHRSYPRDHRGLEGFSVRPEWRGKGVGTAMLDRIVSDARAEGARSLKLNVGDTNPARRLYERAGFIETRSVRVGPFARRLGFKRFVYYELEL